MKVAIANLSLPRLSLVLLVLAAAVYPDTAGHLVLSLASWFCYDRQFLLTMALMLYLLSTLLAFFLGDFLGLYGVFILALTSLLLLWVQLVLNFGFFLLEGGSLQIGLAHWLRLFDHLDAPIMFSIDALSFSFFFLTTTIALFVNIYAFSYFRYEPNVERLVLLLNAFVLSMCILVISGNLVLMFLGWEAIGLTSFLLINFWQTRVGTLKAAFKAYSFNKVSDASLLCALCSLFVLFGDLSPSACNSLALVYNSAVLDHLARVRLVELCVAFLLVAAFVKSAQVGFHVWLPDSMEAPVPASALIHSATLVSAGIFITLRLQPMLELSLLASVLLPLVGAMTALVGGFSALYQTDLKRVLAYSTISHCGFLFILSSLSPIEFTLLYLYVHGFFKASSFLCVGNIIRFSKNYQDSRRMGLYWKYLPCELFFLFFCLANLSGLPLFLGFIVKHAALGAACAGFFGPVARSLAMLAAFCGLFYSYKVFYYVFFDSKRARKSIYFSYASHSHRSNYFSNTTLASNFSICLLVLAAYFFSFLMASGLVMSYSTSLAELGRQLNLPVASYLSAADLSQAFNFKLLNSVVLILFLFLSFYRWSWSWSANYAHASTIALVLILA